MLLNMLWEKTLEMRVTDNDIKYSDKILLPNNVSFNEQRKEFIKNLDTIDLQAVPGSGKTTVLLAKLLILEKHLPFEDGSGILVISHTNAAVDEIKKRIEKYCPHLFIYPNFIVTIQSFVDKFLAIPFYANLYKRKPYRINNEIYNEKMNKLSTIFIKGFKKEESNKAKYFLNTYRKLLNNLRITPINGREVLTDGFFGKEIAVKRPSRNTKPQNYVDWSLQEKERIKEWLFCLKNKFFKDGILCFDDAYLFAMRYLKKYSLIKNLLQSRFRYVFVDEMQDMDKHQYEILENIFYDGGNSKSIYQRIGDKNQAIFSEGEVTLETFWNSEDRNILNIDGSCRFSKEIANVVKYFSLDGRSIESDSVHKSIKPYLLVYTDNTIKNILPKFAEIFEKYRSNNKIPHNVETIVKAIGWRGKAADMEKITIKDYFPEFNEIIKYNKIDYSSLKEYLFSTRNDVNGSCLGGIWNNILNALLKILRYEKINDHGGRYYTKRRLLNFIADQHNELYQEIKLKLFLWCRDIFTGNSNAIYEEIREYIPKFLSSFFGKDQRISKDTIDFINSGNSIENRQEGNTIENRLIKNPNNLFQYDNINIEVGTIHSIKGETHTATLYMETFYQGKYESQRLKEFFKGNFINGDEKPYVKQSLKMAYVGMSRPKYLLCVAVHYDHVIDYLDEIPDDKWEKIEVK